MGDWFRDDLEKEVLSKLDSGAIALLENCRFYVEEEGKGENAKKEKIKADKDKVDAFRKILTGIADLFVCDAFGTCHRAHSSMVGCDAPIKAAGLLVKKELTYFDQALSMCPREEGPRWNCWRAKCCREWPSCRILATLS